MNVSESDEWAGGLDALQAELAILQWRDEQLEAIYEQLHDGMEPLRNGISARIQGIRKRKVVIGELTKGVNDAWAHWAELQGRRAAERARRKLGQVVVPIERPAAAPAALDDLKRPILTAAGGGAATLGAVAAVPGAISAATVTTTSFLVFSSTALSMPILVPASIALALTALVGGGFAVKGGIGLKRWRGQYEKRVWSHLETAIFGIGTPAARPVKGGKRGHGRGETLPCLLKSLQEAILTAAERAIRDLKETRP